MRAPSYPPEAKARAIAALLTGERPRVVAREYGIPESTVTTWRWRLKHGKLRHEKKGTAQAFGALLMEHLEATLIALIAQSASMRDPEWIGRQGAGQLALLFGMLFDRTMRMLELAPAFLGDHWRSQERSEPPGKGGTPMHQL